MSSRLSGLPAARLLAVLDLMQELQVSSTSESNPVVLMQLVEERIPKVANASAVSLFVLDSLAKVYLLIHTSSDPSSSSHRLFFVAANDRLRHR